MKLKEVIHFYLNPFNKTKIRIDDDKEMYLWDIDVAEEYIVNFTAAKKEFRTIEGDDGWMIYNDDETLSRMKPILRRLSSMTEEEIDDVASILLGKETHCYHKWKSEDGQCIIAHWKKEKPLPPYDKEYDYMTMGMLIDNKFSIKHFWDYHNSKGSGSTNEKLHNYHKITHYLLSKHFDIFSLIDSGQAIDRDTLK